MNFLTAIKEYEEKKEAEKLAQARLNIVKNELRILEKERDSLAQKLDNVKSHINNAKAEVDRFDAEYVDAWKDSAKMSDMIVVPKKSVVFENKDGEE